MRDYDYEDTPAFWFEREQEQERRLNEIEERAKNDNR